MRSPVFGLVWVGVFIGAGIVLSLLATLLVAVGVMGMGEGASAAGGAVMIGGALVMAAMFFTSTWFTFRDSFQE